MRAKYILMIAALLASAQADAGETPALAPGEVLLQISAVGTVRTPAESQTFMVPIIQDAETAAAARTLAEQKLARLKIALAAAGISAGAITVSAAGGAMGFIGNQPCDEGMPPALAGAVARPKRFATTNIRIVAKSNAESKAIESVLDQQDVPVAGTPVLALNDPASAQRNAANQALAKAKSDAADYAAAMGLRVLRIVRVSDRDTANTNDFAAFAQMMENSRNPATRDVVTQARIFVDFILAAR